MEDLVGWALGHRVEPVCGNRPVRLCRECLRRAMARCRRKARRRPVYEDRSPAGAPVARHRRSHRDLAPADWVASQLRRPRLGARPPSSGKQREHSNHQRHRQSTEFHTHPHYPLPHYFLPRPPCGGVEGHCKQSASRSAIQGDRRQTDRVTERFRFPDLRLSGTADYLATRFDRRASRG